MRWCDGEHICGIRCGGPGGEGGGGIGVSVPGSRVLSLSCSIEVRRCGDEELGKFVVVLMVV